MRDYYFDDEGLEEPPIARTTKNILYKIKEEFNYNKIFRKIRRYVRTRHLSKYKTYKLQFFN